MMEGSTILIVAMALMMVLLCGGMIVGAATAFRRRARR
jgi:hypothetical protein